MSCPLAGASTVVGGLWDIGDSSFGAFAAVYGGMTRGSSVAGAVRQAIGEMPDDDLRRAAALYP